MRLLLIAGVLFVARIQPSISQQCAVPGLDSYVDRKENASAAVLTNLQTIATSVVPGLSDELGNKSVSSSMDLFDALTTALKIQNTSSFESFADALEEITDAYFLACYGEPSQRATSESLIPTLRDLLILLDSVTTDDTNGTLQSIRTYFGQITCLIDTYGYDYLLLMTTPTDEPPTEADNSTRSRRSTPTDCSDLYSITVRAFYECISSDDLEPIFGLGPFGRDEQGRRVHETKRCVGFVVDTTGSMAGEISEARNNIKKFIQSEQDLPACYVLVEFNDFENSSDPADHVGTANVYDPLIGYQSEVSTLTRTSNLPVKGVQELFADVDALYAHGGGDCPEYGMTGILKAVEAIRSVEKLVLPQDGSNLHHIITLTDASAKDDYLYQQVVDGAKVAKSTVHFFYSGNGCGNFGNYETVRTETGGIAVHNFADFDAFSEFIQLYSSTVVPSSSSTGIGKRATNDDIFSEPANSHSVSINHLIDSLAILAETTEAQVIITKPDGQRETVTVSGTLALYTEDNPLPGLWTISVSSGTLRIIVTAPVVLDLDISYTTVDKDGELIPTEQIPHACDTGTILATSPQLDKISLNHSLYLNLLDSNGSVLEQVELTECRGILSGIVTYPNVSLVFYQVQGHDIHGNPFKKTLVDQEVTFKPPKTPIEISFVQNSPIVTNSSMTAFIQTNKRVSDMKCKISHVKKVKNCTDGYVQFTGLPVHRRYTLKVDATTEDGETASTKRQFRLDRDGYCSVHLINKGLSVEGNKVTMEFTSTGDTTSTACILNPPQTKENPFLPCNSPVVMHLAPGAHAFKITPKGCGKEQRKPLKVEFEVSPPKDYASCSK